MARHTFLRSFMAILGIVAVSGCETPFHRKPVDVKKETTKDEIPTGDVHELKAEGARSFHKPNRLAGGLSDQAREIEGHFNIQ